MSTIRYQLTEAEAVRGLLGQRPRRRRILLSVLLLALGTLELILRRKTHSSAGEIYAIAGCVFIGFGVMGTLLLPLLYRRAYTKLVRANPSLLAMREVTFDERGLSSSSEVQKLEVTWSYFKKLTEDAGHFYLHIDLLGSVSILPKRAFDETTLQDFLKCSRSVPRV